MARFFRKDDGESLSQYTGPLREQGKILIATSGAFDIFHVGHLRYLQRAKYLGGPTGILIVGINSDEAVRKKKGDGRPIHHEDVRIELVLGLSCVDVAMVVSDSELLFLECIQPDFRVYSETSGIVSERFAREVSFLESYGGRYILLPEQSAIHSTDILRATS